MWHIARMTMCMSNALRRALPSMEIVSSTGCHHKKTTGQQSPLLARCPRQCHAEAHCTPFCGSLGFCLTERIRAAN
eukprot:2671322-Amphidinium_carterae.1